ncbi:uncharacterized protein LOC128991315 [Macrosteles quadrilineatus]|uniref:uncharacterized protein LOC128991315 n=1 Tax=Macrosteles quadrilineatus TaxID=74068 RepID=UPI0023E223DD|nr:uncharacterized protein LOC128991315 [Macrosteles quadrilineatus]
MSYNTRRAGGNRPSPTTQVNYHQQPNRPGAGNVAQQNRNAGYSTSQPPVTYNNPTQSYSTPAFSTTPPQPPPKPTTPAQQPQQTQPQQKPQPPLPQAPAPTPSTPAVKPAVVSSTTTPAATNVVPKQEPVTPVSTPVNAAENGEGNSVNKTTPLWKKRPVLKISNKVKRARQNAKLRRILNPKNALTFLNELRPGTGKFAVKEDSAWGGYVATVEVDGKQFTGHGLGASKAKVQASEKALKYLLLEQLSKAQQASAEVKPELEEEDDNMDGGEESKEKNRKPKPEDEVPWGSLAAFALHKLFTEWQKEGPPEAPVVQMPLSYPAEKYDEDVGDEQYFTRRPGPPEFGYRGRGGFRPFPGPGRGQRFMPYPPGPRGPPPPGYGPPAGRLPPHAPNSAVTTFKPQISLGNAAPMKKIPEDANQRHPVMLLNQLKPNLVYNESREGEQPRVTFIISIEVDGRQYVGRGKNKKEAKKQAAIAALAPMGVIYNEVEQMQQ